MLGPGFHSPKLTITRYVILEHCACGYLLVSTSVGLKGAAWKRSTLAEGPGQRNRFQNSEDTANG